MLELSEEFISCLGTSKTECLAAYMRDGQVMARLHRTAERYARLPRGAFIAREIVAEVIEDELAETRRLKFASAATAEEFHRKLYVLLSRAVEKRARRWSEGKGGWLGRKGRSAPRMHSLDDEKTEALAIKLGRMSEASFAAFDFAALLSRIGELARGDDDVELLLALYARDVVTRRAVLRAAPTLTRWRYSQARERLVGYAVTAMRDMTPGAGEASGLKSDNSEARRLAMKLLFGR